MARRQPRPDDRERANPLPPSPGYPAFSGPGVNSAPPGDDSVERTATETGTVIDGSRPASYTFAPPPATTPASRPARGIPQIDPPPCRIQGERGGAKAHRAEAMGRGSSGSWDTQAGRGAMAASARKHRGGARPEAEALEGRM